MTDGTRGWVVAAAVLVSTACGGPPREASPGAGMAPPTPTAEDGGRPDFAAMAGGEGPSEAKEAARGRAPVASVAPVGGTPKGPAAPPAPKPPSLPLASGSGDATDEALAKGDRAYEDSDLATAGSEYGKARALSPAKAAPLVGVARVAVARVDVPLDYAAAKGNKEVQRAAGDLRRAAAMDPTFGPAYVELGRAQLLLGDAPAALAALRKGVERLPDLAEAHSALGVALLATGQGDEALSELARAAQLDPENAPRHGNLGTALFMRGRVPEAIKEYEAEVGADGTDARAHSDLGTALLAHNEVSRATTELRRALSLDPQRATIHSNLGYALQIGGLRAEALAEYREALRLDPKLASAWINLATALARDPAARKEARAALEKARALDPTDPRVKANLEELDALERR